jgi:hypothetical protein
VHKSAPPSAQPRPGGAGEEHRARCRSRLKAPAPWSPAVAPAMPNQHSSREIYECACLPPRSSQCVAFVVAGAAQAALASVLQKPGSNFDLSERQVRLREQARGRLAC